MYHDNNCDDNNGNESNSTNNYDNDNVKNDYDDKDKIMITTMIMIFIIFITEIDNHQKNDGENIMIITSLSMSSPSHFTVVIQLSHMPCL